MFTLIPCAVCPRRGSCAGLPAGGSSALPRFAVTESPLRPRTLATGILAWKSRSWVRAKAVRGNSRHLAVRFWGRSIVDRIRSVSDTRFLSVPSSVRFDGISLTIRWPNTGKQAVAVIHQRRFQTLPEKPIEVNNATSSDVYSSVCNSELLALP